MFAEMFAKFKINQNQPEPKNDYFSIQNQPESTKN